MATPTPTRGKIKVPSWFNISSATDGHAMIEVPEDNSSIGFYNFYGEATPIQENGDEYLLELFSDSIGGEENNDSIRTVMVQAEVYVPGNILVESDDTTNKHLITFEHSALKNVYFAVPAGTRIERINKTYNN